MRTGIRTVVAGIASVVEGDVVLPLAAELAAGTGARLHLVHAFQFTDPVADAYELLGFEGADPDEEFRRSLQEQLESLARRWRVPADTACIVEEGEPAEVICAVAEREGADLVVVGATHRHGISRLLGSTAEQVAREAPAPVLLLRRSLSRDSGRVLFAVDLSDFSEVVREKGMALVEAMRWKDPAAMRVVVVVPYHPLMPPPLARQGLEEIARMELNRFLEEGFQAPPPLGKIRFGKPADEVLAEAQSWKADLLVLGTHGRHGLPRFLLGSVAAEAIRHAPGNVLIVPPLLVHREARGRADSQLLLPLEEEPV